MKLDELIATHVGDTNLDPASVREFLQTSSYYRRWGVHRQLDPTALDQLNATDLFEFYLRQYLTGRHKTLQAVLREVRVFVDRDPGSAPYFITYSLALTREHLLALEWFELLPRLENVTKRIAEVIPKSDHSANPFVVGLLSEFD